MRTNATVSIPLPRLLTKAFFPYSVLVVVVALLFGGGTRQGLWSDVFVQIAALPLLAWALFRLSSVSINRSTRWAIVLLCGILMLPVLQLIPLPPVVWSALPGREKFASTYVAAGMAVPWLPVSLDRYATWRGLVSLIPAAAVFLAMLSLDGSARRVLVAIGLAVALVSVPLDFLQTVGGKDSSLRFYAVTNYDRAIGFFANANHNAAFLYCAIPVAVGWAVGLMRVQRPYRAIAYVLLLILIIAALIGLAFVRSRAGISLGVLAGLFCLALAWRHGKGQTSRRLVFFGLMANLVALLILFQFGFTGLIERVENTEMIDDLRWPVGSATSQAALANMPLGSGFGTFVPVYEMYAPRTLASEAYVNHAHNDWLELWLTGGVPAVVLAFAFVLWFGRAVYSAWYSTPAPDRILDIALARAASIVVVLLLLHSVVDYPLRTAALEVLFAEACALLIPSRGTISHQMQPRRDSLLHSGILQRRG